MKGRRRSISFLVFLLSAVLAGCYHLYETRQVEYAAAQIAKAITMRDALLFERYVDVTRLVERGYDDGSRVLSDNVTDLHERYPEDPFFWHDAAFMRAYTAKHRKDALRFIREGMHRYFIDAGDPPVFSDDPTGFVAHEVGKIIEVTRAAIVEKRASGDRRTTLRVRFDGEPTAYGALANGIEMDLLFERAESGDWRLVEITNAEELLLPVTASAEAFWTMQGWQ